MTSTSATAAATSTSVLSPSTAYPTRRSRGCPLEDLMAFLGKPYVLDILRVFSEEPGPHRFLDLQRRLELSPNTLTSRLRDLVGAGFLTRTAYAEIPPRVDYQGTAKTAQLEEIFEQLGEWARRNDLRPMPVAARSRRVRGLGQVAR